MNDLPDGAEHIISILLLVILLGSIFTWINVFMLIGNIMRGS